MTTSRLLGLVAAALLTVSVARAENTDWICKEAASYRQGEAIVVCGIGLAKTEADARIAAMKQAKREFAELCKASSDCRDREHNVVPLRNSCEVERNEGYRCYRALRYEFVKTNAPRTRSLADMPVGLDHPTSTETEQTALAPLGDTGLVAGLNLLSLGYPAFNNETINFGVGANMRFRFLDILGLEAGVGVDVWPKRAFDSLTGESSVNGLGIGYQGYGAVPVYFLRSGRGSYFIAPEFRYFYHASNHKTTGGLGVGWQDLPAGKETGWGVRFVLSDIVGRQTHTSFLLTATYLFGLY